LVVSFKQIQGQQKGAKAMTEQELNKMLVRRLESAEAQIRDLKSTIRCLSTTAESAKGGLQVRREAQGSVEQLRLAVQGLLHVYEHNHTSTELDKSITFAKKVMFVTERGSY
jgi:hypothetical protein